jgi:hypothetical protein
MKSPCFISESNIYGEVKVTFYEGGDAGVNRVFKFLTD